MDNQKGNELANLTKTNGGLIPIAITVMQSLSVEGNIPSLHLIS